MKKIFLFLAVIATVLFGWIPAPVHAQDVPHQYNIATPTTPIARWVVKGDKLWITSTGQIIEVTKTFGPTETISSIVTNGSFKYYPSGNSGLATLTPATTNTGSIGTVSLQWGSGYFHYITGDWGAFTKTTGTYTKFDTDTVTTLYVSGNEKINGNIYLGGRMVQNCAVPAPFDSTGTIPAAKMLRGVIKCTSASAVSMTTPTATAISSLIAGCGQGTTFSLIIDNTGSATGVVTLVMDGSITVGTGVITGGNTLTVAVGQTGRFTFYFNSTSAARCYRVF